MKDEKLRDENPKALEWENFKPTGVWEADKAYPGSSRWLDARANPLPTQTAEINGPARKSVERLKVELANAEFDRVKDTINPIQSAEFPDDEFDDWLINNSTVQSYDSLVYPDHEECARWAWNRALKGKGE